jgi:hypothetical protein
LDFAVLAGFVAFVDFEVLADLVDFATLSAIFLIFLDAFAGFVALVDLVAEVIFEAAAFVVVFAAGTVFVAVAAIAVPVMRNADATIDASSFFKMLSSFPQKWQRFGRNESLSSLPKDAPV